MFYSISAGQPVFFGTFNVPIGSMPAIALRETDDAGLVLAHSPLGYGKEKPLTGLAGMAALRLEMGGMVRPAVKH